MVGSVYWEDNDLERIKNYCQKDVVTTVRLFQKFKNEAWVKDSEIELVD